MHAVILAGGRGSRLRPLTDTRPKPLLPFVGDPFAAGLLRRLAACGCNEATFLVGRDAAPFAPLEPLGDRLGLPVRVVTETQPLDTAGAARDLLRARRDDRPVLVCNADILTDLDYAGLCAAHQDAGATATLALTRVADTSSYGVVECDGRGRVRRFLEKPPPGSARADTVNAGTYVLSPEALDRFPQGAPLSFERTVFPGLLAAGVTVLGRTSAAFWLDVGTPQRYLAGHAAVLSDRCAWPLGHRYVRRGGVLVHDSAAVDEAATLSGHVVVGPRNHVAAGADLSDAVLFEDVSVGANAKVTNSVVAERATVAAGAVVGPGALVAADQRVA